jgi:hypothetical protein
MKFKAALVVGLLTSLVLGVTPSHAAPMPMKEQGTGDAVGESCGSGSACFDFESSADGTPINNGRFIGRTRLITGDTFQNPDGQTCVYGRGHGTFRKGPNNRIRIEFEGPWCIFRPNPGKGTGRLKGYYTVTGGRGDFNGARGRGGINMVFAFAKASEFRFRSDGTLNP